MDSVSSYLRPGQRAWVLRDDLTGFALGGNKVRKLEYILGRARAGKVDTLVVAGACSFSRNAAAAGKAFGFDVHVLVGGDAAGQNPLSRDYFTLMGATVHYVGNVDALPDAQRELVRHLRAEGRAVEELHPGGSDTTGTLGYIEAFAEIAEWSDREGVSISRVYCASGSAATQAGLVLGQSISQREEIRITGIAISKRAEAQEQRVTALARATAEMLGVDFDPNRVQVDDRYLGDGYPIPSPASRAAAQLFARTEGLLFDPVYVGKVGAALLAHARSGELAAAQNVLLIHTGGNAGVYDAKPPA